MTAPSPPLDAAQAVQEGVYALLTDDAELMALVAGVWDEVPEAASLDYVTIRDTLAVPEGTHDSYGERVTLTLHTWTWARGNAPGNAIAGRCYSLLHQQAAALNPHVAGHTVYIVRREFRQSLNDPQPNIRHRVDRYRMNVYQDQGD